MVIISKTFSRCLSLVWLLYSVIVNGLFCSAPVDIALRTLRVFSVRSLPATLCTLLSFSLCKIKHVTFWYHLRFKAFLILAVALSYRSLKKSGCLVGTGTYQHVSWNPCDALRDLYRQSCDTLSLITVIMYLFLGVGRVSLPSMRSGAFLASYHGLGNASVKKYVPYYRGSGFKICVAIVAN